MPFFCGTRADALDVGVEFVGGVCAPSTSASPLAVAVMLVVLVGFCDWADDGGGRPMYSLTRAFCSLFGPEVGAERAVRTVVTSVAGQDLVWCGRH